MSKYASHSDVVETITSASNDISHAIGELSTTLASPPESGILTKLLLAAAVALIGAFSAYSFNYLHWKIVEKKRKATKISGELHTLVAELEIMAIKYWVQDFYPQNKVENSTIEITLKSKLLLIYHVIKFSVPLLDAQKQNSISLELKNFHSEIFELVTDGEFESVNRKASKARAMRISNKCSSIRAKMLSLDMDI